LNSVVCISHVPDTGGRIKVDGGRKVDEAGLKFIVPPYDEIALEAAIRLKEEIRWRCHRAHVRPRARAAGAARGAGPWTTRAMHVKAILPSADSLGIAKVLRRCHPDRAARLWCSSASQGVVRTNG